MSLVCSSGRDNVQWLVNVVLECFVQLCIMEVCMCVMCCDIVVEHGTEC